MTINLRLQKAQAALDVYYSLSESTRQRKAISTRFRIVDKNSYFKDFFYHFISFFLPGNCHLEQTKPKWVLARLHKKVKNLDPENQKRLKDITAQFPCSSKAV